MNSDINPNHDPEVADIFTDDDELDVDGHGFRGVAIGLGVAGVVLGGVAAAAPPAHPAAPSARAIALDVSRVTDLLQPTVIADPPEAFDAGGERTPKVR